MSKFTANSSDAGVSPPGYGFLGLDTDGEVARIAREGCTTGLY